MNFVDGLAERVERGLKSGDLGQLGGLRGREDVLVNHVDPARKQTINDGCIDGIAARRSTLALARRRPVDGVTAIRGGAASTRRRRCDVQDAATDMHFASMSTVPT